MAIFSGPEISNDGLVLHLDAANPRSYPGTGTTWTDLSGNSRNFTLINGPTFNSTNQGSIDQDGTNDYISRSYNSDLAFNGNTDFSIGLIIKNKSLIANASNYPYIISCGNQDGGYGGYYWALYNDNGNGRPFGSIDVGRANTSTRWGVGYNYLSTADALAIDNWVYTYSSTTGSSLYRNDKLITSSLQTGSIVRGSTLPLTIGMRPAFNSVTNCSIYNVKIYNRVLSAVEIQQNFEATRGRYGI